jgi:single-strand DNA-binding protein
MPYVCGYGQASSSREPFHLANWSASLMAGETPITLIGNLVEDPILKFTPQGAAVAKFRLASTPRFFDKATNSWRDGEGLFLTCIVWRQMAEQVAESLAKGARAIVVGRLAQRSYEAKDGSKKMVFEVEVDEIGPSLKFATAKVQRMSRSSSGSAPSGGGTDDPWSTTAGFADDSPPF